MTSSDYLHPPQATRSRTGLLCLACLIVGMLAGGLGVWAARPTAMTPMPAAALSTITQMTMPTTTTTTTTAMAGGRPADVASRCRATEEPRSPIATVAEFRSLVTRAWMQCTDISVFGTKDEVGFELLGDSTVYKLYAAEDGTVTRGDGFDGRGTWHIIDVSAMNARPTFQIQMLVGRGGGGGIPILTAEPLKMRLNNTGEFVADYVAIG